MGLLCLASAWHASLCVTAPNTHPSIDASLCGELVSLAPGVAELELRTDARMAADPRGLVHGGFVFGAADYAAMLAVNHPNVVLGSASVKFTAPVQVGQVVRVRAELRSEQGRKREVEVKATVDALVLAGAYTPVFEGTFTCFVLDTHVLDR
jgi:acyl-coenzyme A thioesterase PaaI-like protein